MINLNDIRNIFISFFKENDHIYINSSSLVSNTNDLLFTNSGMNQFKNYFYDNSNLINKNIVSSQRCLRISGKHNDINNIGYSDKHSTFFEMLGNFSFGEYFKEKSIFLAWKFLTDKNLLSLNKDKIIVTVYYNDYESISIWKKMGLSESKIIKIGDLNEKYNSDNFWRISYFGLCGPCTEIYYDLNSYNNYYKYNNINNKYIEIWNLVFIQFNYFEGKLNKLEFNSIDTGMGLERITSVIQNVYSIYDINLFKELITLIKIKLNNYIKKNIDNIYLKIIFDHIKSVIFIINDNVLPSNEKHGYVLRKLIRRCYLIVRSFEINDPLLYKLVDLFINTLLKYYNNLSINKIKYIENIILNEELKFIKIINNGLYILKNNINKFLINNCLDDTSINKLYDTYGLPYDIIINYCNLNNIKINIKNINRFNKI